MRRIDPGRSRALRRYWRTVKTIRRDNETNTVDARALYREARLTLPPGWTVQRDIIKAAKVVREIEASAPKYEFFPAEPTILLDGRAFASFGIRVNYPHLDSKITTIGLEGFFGASFEVYDSSGKLLDSFTIRWKSSAKEIESWWSGYFLALREAAGFAHYDPAAGGKPKVSPLYDRLNEKFGGVALSVEIVRLVKFPD